MTDEPEGRHHFQLKGAAAEAVVHSLASESFFVDWCYPNPVLSDGKELCDLLVVFDNVAIIFQVKSLKLGEDGHYKAGEVQKNLRQAAGAARRLLDDRLPVEFENVRRGREVFDPATVTKVHLISVLDGEGEDFYSPMENVGGYVVHVLTREVMELLLEELDTIGDFVAYLAAKEAFFESRHVIVDGGEEELLALYLKADRSFAEYREATSLMVDRGIWEDLKSRGQYRAKKAADEVSYGWDSLIDRAHESLDPTYERVARELARLTRFERRCMGQTMLDAWVTASNEKDHPIFRRTVDFNGRTYVFLFMDDPTREARRAQLQALGLAARGKLRHNSVVIGVATEKALEPECSYDYLYLDMPVWTEEDESTYETLCRDAGFYSDVEVARVQADEYPGSASPRPAKVGRNDPCPCGSGKKYKHCCLE